MTEMMNGINKFWTIRVAESGLIFLTFMAGEEGFEPSLTDSESAVLPLDYSPTHQNYNTKLYHQQYVAYHFSTNRSLAVFDLAKIAV